MRTSRPEPPRSGSTSPGSTAGDGISFPSVWPVFGGTTALLLLAAWTNRGALNADAIAYLRIAGYYAEGSLDLAVSGYWGPLLSWLIAPLLKLGVAPLAAGRVVMAGSALVFLAGVWAVMKSFATAAGRCGGEAATGLSPIWARLGLVLAGGAVVSWSVEYISPDLLQAGLWLLGLAAVVDGHWPAEPRRATVAGLFFGGAYLAKSVALPLAVASVLGLWLWKWARDRSHPGGGWRHMAITLGVTFLVAAPWITVLSVKYGHPTFSTSARIAHAVVGPDQGQRSHSFGRMFHRPPAGRITVWEDPSGMPYRYWSPFESKEAFWHQLAICREHARTVLELWHTLDWLMLGAVACLYTVLMLAKRGLRGFREPWLPAVIPLAALSTLYLPVYIQPVDQRYLYAAWPLLYILAGGMMGALASRLGHQGWPRRVILRWLPTISFGLPALVGLTFALTGYPNPAAEAATSLAARLQRAGIVGPVAGSGMFFGGRAGLYVAYLTDQQWLGDEPQATAERYASTGARLVIVNRRQAAADQLANSPGFADLDSRLFATPEQAAAFPLRVFERREGESSRR